MHLDSARKMELVKHFRDVVNQREKTILFSTHEWDIVLDQIDVLWVLNDEGQLISTTPEDLILSNGLTALFGDEAHNFNHELGRPCVEREGESRVTVKGGGPLVEKWTSHYLMKSAPSSEGVVEVRSADKGLVWSYQGSECRTLLELGRLLEKT